MPIVTRVHGKVVGGGVGIVAASDYAIATENASLRLSELAVGHRPVRRGTGDRAKGRRRRAQRDGDRRRLARRRVGRAARPVRARGRERRARSSGAIATFAQRLATSNPEATALIKRATWAGTDDWPALLEERAAMSGRLVLSEFTKQAIAAFSAR